MEPVGTWCTVLMQVSAIILEIHTYLSPASSLPIVKSTFFDHYTSDFLREPYREMHSKVTA